MAEIDAKAKALSEARNRILQLQEQMTDRVLQMAAEVEKLMGIVPAKEARAFLKARCNLPAQELSTYVGFAMTLKGSEEVLQQARVSFPVMKSLVSADAETRTEILERMELGAQIDTKDVATIRRRLANAKLTVAESLAVRDRRLVAAALRKQTKLTMSRFRENLSAFVDDVRKLRNESPSVPDALRTRAGALFGEFGSLFGAEHGSLHGLKEGTPAYRVTRAHHALQRFRDDGFNNKFGFGLRDSDIGPTAIDALQAMTGRPPKVYGLVRLPKGLTELPPQRYHLRVLELCAGGGGMAIGLERAGFQPVGLIEIDKHAAATLRKNRPKWPVVEADVRNVDFTQYRGKVDLLAGGVPCTPYSTIGERKGKWDENDLFPEAIRAVKEARPSAFIFENVEGLLHAKHADHVAAVLQEFSKAGYETVIERINSRDYGVAQNRSRILLVGLRRDLSGSFRMPPKFPEMAIDMGQALRDLMGANGWSGAGKWVRKMGETTVDDGAGNLIRTGVLADTIRGYKGSGHKGEKARWLRNGVAYAPIAKSAPTDDEGRAEGFIPRLTNKMRARLQGFPDDWQFVGSIPSVADQIGNAVTPVVAQAVGLAMFTALRGTEFDMAAMLNLTGQAPGNQPRTRLEVPPLVPELIASDGRLEVVDL
ncbi:DNA cytosine methyltransferase [Rhizobium leguminosarum]|uniref:DNA cytosine methyltransferase n=1 Tax=Rhizobium leguminosarum TaxID=384 RepID=UPI00102F937B|nr:DNA cytosine methyltransferase [Rhizobium leguminosarum]TAY17121.1 DNA cytosine methyltransferase [Rhizobium leguminosarum]